MGNSDDNVNLSSYTVIYDKRMGEKPGETLELNHPLGAVQDVIRGHFYFAVFGLFAIGIALLFLYSIWVDRTPIENFTDSPQKRLIFTAALLGIVAFGLWLVNLSFCRVRLRRTGFEIANLFGIKTYEYKYVYFDLQKVLTEQIVRGPDHGAGTSFKNVWQCRILFNDGSNPLILASTRYAQLRYKAQNLIHSLTKIENPQ